MNGYSHKIFDKTPERIAKLVNKTWLFRYPQCHHLIYDNGGEFKLHFEYLCESYGIKRKPTTVKNPMSEWYIGTCTSSTRTNATHG
jgi:hypothetical protein